MLVYTIVTAAFYMLGVALLHGQGEIPKDGTAYLAHLDSIRRLLVWQPPGTDQC